MTISEKGLPESTDSFLHAELILPEHPTLRGCSRGWISCSYSECGIYELHRFE